MARLVDRVLTAARHSLRSFATLRLGVILLRFFNLLRSWLGARVPDQTHLFTALLPAVLQRQLSNQFTIGSFSSCPARNGLHSDAETLPLLLLLSDSDDRLRPALAAGVRPES